MNFIVAGCLSGQVYRMKILNSELLNGLSSQASESRRLRQHLNLHSSYEEPSQRLLNAMEPASYIRPHRHLRDPKPENFVGLRGRMALLIFDDAGRVEQIVPFGPGEDALGIDLPPGVWHTVLSLEAGSVLFETKPGPFLPIFKKDVAPWAPEEGSDAAKPYLEDLVRKVQAWDKVQKLA